MDIPVTDRQEAIFNYHISAIEAVRTSGKWEMSNGRTSDWEAVNT